MRCEWWLANLALFSLSLVVAWDVLVFFGVVSGHTVTDEIRSDWRSWAFFALAGMVAGGHFLRGK
jgi:hypothetical protein